MPQAPVDQVLVMFQEGMMLLSIMACIHVLAMRRRGPVVPYEPRRPVPWGPVGSLLALLFLATLAFGVIVSHGHAVDHLVESSPEASSALTLLGSMVAQLIIVLAFLFVVAMFSQASARDLGLVSNSRERWRDVLIGAAACLTALAPVFYTQLAMMYFFFPDKMQSGQPLIKQLLANPDPTMLIVAGVATVIIAPICEEITFRLLFQGWLERWEDDRLGWRKPATQAPLPAESEHGGDAAEQVELSTTPQPEPVPPQKGIGGLAYGWFPIFISATAFGLAHYGDGPEPVPLFVLGLVLGYVYQRTHRLLPSIVTHALFNLFTMIILWRMMYHHG